MSKKIQLTIAEPCHENWENMTPVEKGKFCGSCQKQVVDFSLMSDRQVAEFFKKPSTGSVCGRFMTDQLHRDIEIPKKRIPWLKYFFTIAVPAFFISKSSAQDISKSKHATDSTKIATPPIRITLGMVAPRITEKTVCKDTTELLVKGKVAFTKPISVLGKVTDENGKALPGASVTIKNAKIGMATVEDGTFNIAPDNKWDKIILVISALGFETKELVVNKNEYTANSLLTINMVPVDYAIMGGISFCEVEEKTETIKTIPEIIKDADTKSFKAYPNPVVSGSVITIEWKQKEEGYFTLQLLNLSGQAAHRQEIWIDGASKSVSADVPFIAAGNYFLVLTNKKTGKKYSEKIVIQ